MWKWSLMLGVVVAGLLVARIARRSGTSRLAALGAALLVVASAASRSLGWGPAGWSFLGATLVLLVAFERSDALRRRPWLFVIAAVASSAALLAFALRDAPALPGAGPTSFAAAAGPLAAESARRGFGLLAPRPFLTGSPLLLVPIGFLLPVVAAIAWLAASWLRGAALPVALLIAGLQLWTGGPPKSERLYLESAMPHAVGASRLAELDRSPEPLEAALVAAGNGERLPASVDEALALRVASMRENRGEREAALAGLERWLEARAGTPRASEVPEARARVVALAFATRGPEAAAAQLERDLTQFGRDPRYVASLAPALVDALGRAAPDPTLVSIVVPLVGRLLEDVASRPERATCDELLALALLRVGERRYVDAVKLAELAAAKEPARARPHVVIARIYLGLDEREAGLREVALARRLEPKDAAAQLLEGRLLCGSADFAERGQQRMLAALEADGSLPGIREEIEEGLFVAANALVGAGRSEKATLLIEQTIGAIGRRPGLVHALGRIDMSRRDFVSAVAKYEEAFAAAPERPELRRDLAEALRETGYGHLIAKERDAAVACFERAIAIAPPDVDVGGMRAVVESARPPDPAEEQKLEAARAAYDEGTRLYATGDLEKAKASFARSIELLPMNPLAHVNLGRIELELERAKEAEVHLRTAIAVGAARSIEVEDAWPFLLRALVDQEADEAKLRAVVDDYLKRYPSGRFRETFAKLAH